MELEQVLQLLDQEHQIKFFLETARIPGVSLHEHSFAEYIEPILDEMGFQVAYDNAGDKLGSDSGNLIAYWPGTDPEAEPILFSAHMDTILDSSGCQPKIQDGVIHADGRFILGSDDRSAISAYIEGIRAVQASHMPCGPIELLFTVDEQHGLCGARELDVSKVRSRHGYIFDHPGDVGQVVRWSPYWRPFNIWFRMKNGTAGGHISEKADLSNAFDMGTEAYRNMERGYFDNHQTAVMVGILRGGEVSSIVPGELYMRGEVRSYRKELAQRRLEQLHGACEKAAQAYGGTVEFQVEDGYEGYEIGSSNPAYLCFQNAAKSSGIVCYPDRVLGGADTNFLRSHGINCLTLGNGYRDTHTFQESISIQNLENMARMTVSIIYHWYRQNRK